jgi:hypothetical protein
VKAEMLKDWGEGMKAPAFGEASPLWGGEKLKR